MYFVKVIKSFDEGRDDCNVICMTDLLSLATGVYLDCVTNLSQGVVSGSLNCKRVRVYLSRSQKKILFSDLIPVTHESQLKLK